MKNVLLLCLSPVKAGAKTAEYSYTAKDGEEVTLLGSMTNEAPAKCVIDELYRQGINSRLNKVVMICSDLLKEPIGEGVTETHIDYYKRVVNDFALKLDPKYEQRPICYQEISVENYTEANAISLAAVTAAQEILSAGEENEKINLYIDYNGGQRYFALMLLAVSNLMKQHGVKIAKVLTMNYETRLKNKIQIQNLYPIFNCINLVAAINEYVNFGRISTLKEYFAPAMALDKNINSIISRLSEFAQNLLLCNCVEIEETKADFDRALVTYLASESAPESGDLEAYRTLFRFVVKDIHKELRPFLTGRLPDMLLWCVKHDYIQQSLTLLNELLPEYMVEANLLKPTSLEEKEYALFKQRLAEKPRREWERDFLKYSAVCEKTSSRYYYEWFTNYLREHTVEEAKGYEKIVPENSLLRLRLAPAVVEAELNFPQKSVLSEKCWGKNEGLQGFRTAAKNAKQVLAFANMGAKGRCFIPRANKRDLAELLVVYFILKEQRNAANHAGLARTKISYEELTALVGRAAEFMKRL